MSPKESADYGQVIYAQFEKFKGKETKEKENKDISHIAVISTCVSVLDDI